MGFRRIVRRLPSWVWRCMTVALGFTFVGYAIHLLNSRAAPWYNWRGQLVVGAPEFLVIGILIVVAGVFVPSR